LTSEVVRQLIADARQRVTLVSYAAYQVPSIIAALDAAAARGVHVDLILESPDHLDGGGGATAYAKYRTYQWPTDQREPPDAKLHAKAVIVDSRDVLLTSANMTNAAYDKNIELGLLCRGGSTAHRVQKHLDALIARGVLRRTVRDSAR
jgi:phosphatidylserine/phosphatidylglycerophosphate/cardiolipin synthase-like enzyme